MTLTLPQFRILLIFLLLLTLFTSCAEETLSEDSTVNTTEQENPEINLVVGDWVSPTEHNDNLSYIYRFKSDRTVLIGRINLTPILQNPSNTQISFISTIKFYYRSNWSVSNNQLYINGDIWSTESIDITNVEEQEMYLNYRLNHPSSSDRAYFSKINVNDSDYDRVVDLSQIQINSQAFSGIWSDLETNWSYYDGKVAYDLSSGLAIRYMALNPSNRQLTDLTDSNTSHAQVRYRFLTEEYNGQTLQKEAVKTQINPFGNHISQSYKIEDFDIDSNGEINYMQFRTINFGLSYFYRLN